VGRLARDADVSLLALTHLSNRYFGPEVAREARTIFPETVVPKDFDVIDVPFPERGSPQLVKGGARSRGVIGGELAERETESVP
jgi:ribonuclease Z